MLLDVKVFLVFGAVVGENKVIEYLEGLLDFGVD